MKKKLKVFLIVLLGILLALALGGTLWIKSSSYPASLSATNASSAAISEADYYFFSGESHNDKALIFFPGALVDPASYAIWAQETAEAGYDVYLLKVPLNLAVLAGDKPAEIIKEHPQQQFIVGGHSLGGVMAARFAADQAEQIAGVIFLASYPDAKGSLRDTNLPVLSITASNDKILNWENYQDAEKYLPAKTVYEKIQGGNHGGFGSYGQQKGDGQATLSNEEQQEEIAVMILQWLSAI